MKPTKNTYDTLQNSYDFFNEKLFDNELPHCLITLQRKGKAYGYYSPKRFKNLSSEDFTDEIALNPIMLVEGNQEAMQTLVHEMCHLWQYHFGSPSRAGYHNREWASKMESIGLMPSSTGKVGGKKTGQSVADYALAEDRFLRAFEIWNKDNVLEWYAIENSLLQLLQMTNQGGGGLASALNDDTKPAGAKKNKTKFICPECGCNAWGKPSLNLICGDCNRPMETIDE